MDREVVTSKPGVLEQVRGVLGALHYSKWTGKAYVEWADRYLRFHRPQAGRR